MSEAVNERAGGLLAWQFADYGSRHKARANLIVHALTNPIFLAGNLIAITAPLTHWWMALAGLGISLVAFGLQGVMHKRIEALAPIPFRSRGDLIARTFAEQWITWPRFVLSGGFTRAWRGTES